MTQDENGTNTTCPFLDLTILQCGCPVLKVQGIQVMRQLYPARTSSASESQPREKAWHALFLYPAYCGYKLKLHTKQRNTKGINSHTKTSEAASAFLFSGVSNAIQTRPAPRRPDCTRILSPCSALGDLTTERRKMLNVEPRSECGST